MEPKYYISFCLYSCNSHCANIFNEFPNYYTYYSLLNVKFSLIDSFVV